MNRPSRPSRGRQQFRAPNEAVTLAKPEERKSPAGRPGYDAILKFKMVVLVEPSSAEDWHIGAMTPRLVSARLPIAVG